MLPKRIISTASIAVLAAVSMVVLIPRHSARAQSTNSLGTDPIIGSWHVTVSFDDGRPNVLTLYTFDRDRNFVMDGSWPGLFGAGNGSWNHDQDNNLNLTFFRLLYSPSETNEVTGALNGAFNGTLKVQARLTVSDDRQSFSGRYLLTNFDANGISAPRLSAILTPRALSLNRCCRDQGAGPATCPRSLKSIWRRT